MSKCHLQIIERDSHSSQVEAQQSTLYPYSLLLTGNFFLDYFHGDS
jgi:hypothetical protein